MMQIGNFNWEDAAGKQLLQAGHQLGETALLFEKSRG